MNKFKAIFLVMLSAFIGIFSNPEMLTASDSVAVSGLNEANIVRTVVPETVSETAAAEEPEVAYNDDSYDYSYDYYEPVYEEPVYYMPANYIEIGGMIIPLEYTTYTAENAGGAQQAWYYHTGHWIYGHNYDYVFGPLDWAYDGGYLKGMTFTVVMNGVSTTYTVTDYRLYDFVDGYTLRDVDSGKTTGMVPIINAYLDGTFHGMAIMTCYAGSSQRLVLYAD